MNADIAAALADPRTFPEPCDVPADIAALHRLAESSLAADTGVQADALGRDLGAALSARLEGEGAGLAAVFRGVPSVAVARQLWRTLDRAWRDASLAAGPGVAITTFAIPIVIVAGAEGGAAAGPLAGTLAAPEALAALLREHGALAGNENFGLADALVGADAIDVGRLPEILAWQRLPDSASAPMPARVLAPAPMPLAAGHETVGLRFLVGTALARPGLDLLAGRTVGKWGVPFTRMLSQELARHGASVLAMPRAPDWLLPAVLHGRLAQREASAHVFVSNAVRKLRASVGEPTAVISAHRTPDAPHGGEIRLSLSSPFEPRDAEGFRCPLYLQDRVADVVAMLTDLLRECRVADVRVRSGVHADRDPGTGLVLLFKADSEADSLH